MKTKQLKDNSKTKAQLIEELNDLRKQMARLTLEVDKPENIVKLINGNNPNILDCLTEHIIYMDTDLKIKWANKAACISAGIKRENIIEKYCYEVWQNRKEVCPNCPAQNAIKTNKFHQFEKTNQDGRSWFIRGYPVLNDEEKIAGAIEITLETTKLKHSEKALVESEFKYRTLFESMAQGVVYQDAKGDIITANPAAENILGLTIDQMQGRTSLDPRWHTIHEDGSKFPGETHPAMVALSTGQKVRDVVMGVFNPKIEKHTWINVNATPQFNPGETRPYQVYTTFETITKFKETEKELKKHLAYEHLLSEISLLANNEKKLDKFIEKCLSLIFDALDVSRTYIFKYDHETETLSNTFEQVAKGISAEKDNLQQVPASATPWWIKLMKKNKIINYKDINEIPAQTEKSLLQQQNIKSILVVPLFVYRKFYGFIGFDECRFHREWHQPDVKFLHSVSRIITQNIERRQSELAVLESEKLLRNVIDASPYTIYVKDRDGKYILVNKTMAESHNMTPKDLVGKTDISIARKWLNSPEKIERFRAAERKVTDKKRTLFIQEEKFIFQDGNEKWYQTIKTPISLKDNPNCLMAIAVDITARKNAEEALRINEERLDLAMSVANDGMWDWDLVTNQTYFDPRYYTMAGYKPNEFPGTFEEWAKRVHPDDFNLAESEVRKYIKGKIPAYDVEFRFSCKDKTWIWIRARGKIVGFDKKGKPLRMVGTHSDITERKKYEKALQESEARFRATVESSPMGMHFYELTDKEQLIFYDANPAADKLLAIDNSVFIGKTIEDAFPPLAKTEIPAKYKEVARTGKSWETRHINYEHDEIKGAFDVVAFQTEPNRMVALFNDITERMKAEVALRESEEKFRILIEQSNDAIYLLFENKFEIINSRFQHMFGYTIEECQAPGFNFRQLVSPKSLTLIEDRLKQQKEGKSLKPVYEFTALNKAGKEIECEVCTSYIEYKGGTAIQGIIRDITDRKRAEEDKAKLEKQLRHSQKLETIGTLAGGIAHDFNNILAPIMGYTDMALINLEESSPLYEDMQQILKAAHRAKELVEQILLFSKQVEKERQPLNLQTLLKEALKLLRPSIPAIVDIRQKIDEKCDNIRADATQIHQVIVNLCTNAWQAMEEKGGILSIKLSQKKIDENMAKIYPNLMAADFVCLSISDTGPGIEEKLLDRIFEPFFTTKPVEKGTGLGLSVVHGIIRSHKGEIIVRSEVGKGTSFDIYLPTIKSENNAIHKKPMNVIGGNETIMIVDDEASITELLKRMLESYGYKTEIFNNAFDAIKAFKKKPQRFDILISDLTMPQMTGLDLSEQIHKLRAEFPIIIITGFGHKLTNVMQEQYGIKQVVPKPIVLKDLATAVRKVLDN